MFNQNPKLLIRQYKLFNETILWTASHISNDFIYTCGINGIIYKLAKRDVCRLIHKSKDKLKGNIAKKVVKIKRQKHDDPGNKQAGKEVIQLDFSDIEEDPEEGYLYSQNDCAITNFCVSSDSCNGMGKASPDLWLDDYKRKHATMTSKQAANLEKESKNQ